MTGPLQFRFDPNRCTGCEACVVGCWMHHRDHQSQPWRRIQTFNRMHHPNLPVFHLSLACHHCDHPACLENCPAEAYRRDPATGAVIIQADRCMGCRYCTWACPHDAPRFNETLGTIEKCTFCQDRLEQGQEPACVARCPVEALAVEPRGPARGALPPGFPASALAPGIRFLPRLRPGPRLTAPAPAAAVARHFQALLQVPEAKITLRGEWALLLFTSTLAVLAGLMLARLGAVPVRQPYLVLAAGAVAMVLSAWHLGRPERAWRALSNLRRSWLSREIALVSGFLGLSGLSLLVWPGSGPIRVAAAVAGLAALYAVDRVYQVASKVGPLNFHSAHALFNGLYLAGILARWWWLAVPAGLLKLALYLNRKAHFRRQGRPDRPWWSRLRLLLGFVVPALAFGHGLGALAAVLGDLMDRCEYYDELDIPTPAATLVWDLGALARRP